MKKTLLALLTSILSISSLASIDIASGTETEIETDYVFKSSQPFSFSRYYNHAYKIWQYDFDNTIKYSHINSIETLSINRANFENIIFKKINTNWVQIGTKSFLTFTFDSNNNLILKTPSGDTEIYTNSNQQLNSDTVFFLSQINKKNGEYLNFSHPSILKTVVTDSNNNEFIINYTFCNNQKLVNSFIGVGNKAIIYNYASCHLSSVLYPDSSSINYTYSSGYLTKISGTNNNVLKTISYANSTNSYQPGHKATSESYGNLANINKITSNYSISNIVKITDSLNNSVNVNTIKDVSYKIVGYDSICTFCNGIQGSHITYNSNGLIDTVTDYNGNIHKYIWDKNKIIQTIQAFSTPNEKNYFFTYDSQDNLITKTEPVSGGNKTTNYTYNSNNLVTNITEIAPSNSNTHPLPISKSFNFMYDGSKISEVRSPTYSSTNLDKILFDYNSKGQVFSITNALNHSIFFNNYDDYGNPTLITLPNNNVIIMNYDLNGRLINSTLKSSLLSSDAETTFYIYSIDGLVTKIIKPSGSFYTMHYDTSFRLTSVEEWAEPTNSFPNGIYQGKITYTLDNMSNIKNIDVYNKDNLIIRTNSNTYDSKNRLYKNIASLNQTTTYLYDNNSNLINITDANGFSTINTYDNLNRIISITYPNQSIVSFNYNSDDTISSIIDPKELTTSYEYDGFGNLIKQNSPDTGITTYSYDLNDNITQKVDANGNQKNYTYDILDRLTNIIFNNSTQFMSLTYDNCMIGKLCSTIDNNGTTSYFYNSKGKLIEKNLNYSIGSQSFNKSIHYTYNSIGQLVEIIYPNQNKVIYDYFNDKIKNVSYFIYSKNQTIPLISNIEYTPFSNIEESFTWNTDSGVYSHIKLINKDGIISSISNSQSSGFNATYTHDNLFNISNIEQNNILVNNTYDKNSKLLSSDYIDSIASITTNNNFNYNSSNDRTSSNINNINSTYNYDNNSHKLLTISSNNINSFTYTYDNNGNIVTDNQNSFVYDHNNRLTQSSNSNIISNYFYNIFGERYYKETVSSNNNKNDWFIYDGSKIMYEFSDINNSLVNEINYIYLNGNPITMIKNDEIHYIHTDHLGTPRVILDKNNSLVWKWNYSEPFGNNYPEETGLEFNLRFPGQYWDSEKSSSYNINRDYNPITGRYLQSDPIGLNAGFNTYLYANGNSLKFIDNYGLDTIVYPLYSSSKDNWFINLGYDIEEFYKTKFDFNPNILRLVGHGSPISLNHMTPNQLASQIISGMFLLDNHDNNPDNDLTVINKYYYNQIKQNKPIIIKLDSCNTGLPYGSQQPFAQNLLNILKQNTPSHIPITIIAPTGSVSWFLGRDFISSPPNQLQSINSQLIWQTFK